MKFNEIKIPSTKKLTEQLDLDNQTGFLTEDLVKIVQEDRACKFSKLMTMEELLSEMAEWDNE